MKKLTQSGLVSSRKDGTWVKYKINSEAYQKLVNELTLFKSTEKCEC
jgi:DNA-binding transcriptional ArsR family regulator